MKNSHQVERTDARYSKEYFLSSWCIKSEQIFFGGMEEK
jgi:hypothetical protein